MRTFVTALLLVTLGPSSQALEIRRVGADRLQTKSPMTKPLSVRFELSEPASTELRIFDARDYLIRRVQSAGALAAGSHDLEWDGKDDSGRPVPPGAYRYLLAARSSDGVEVVYDLSDLTGGRPLRARQVEWEAKEGQISYVLPGPAIVSVRIGLRNDGPLLRTLVDWLPRPAGPNREAWDGLDSSGVIRLSEHENREIAVSAFALSDNTILVGETREPALFVDLGDARPLARSRSNEGPPRRGNPSIQPAHERGDIEIALTLVEPGGNDADGLPVVSGKVPIRLTVDESDQRRTANRRFEAAFFVDGLKVFENEIGFFPMTWYWDATHINPGVHYVTANLIGYEGNFGMSTLRLRVRAEGEGG